MKLMKRIIFLSCFFMTTFLFSQKVEIQNKKLELKFKTPELFKNLKTFSYEIQDDGKYWNHNYEEDVEKPANYKENRTLQSFTKGLTIDGLKQVEENGDLQIVVGFIGSQLINDKGAIKFQGTMNIMMLVDGDKLLQNEVKDISVTKMANLKNYPIENRFLRNKTKALILTEEVQKYINTLNFIFQGKSKVSLPFGFFRKTKKGQAEEFNKISKPLVEEIVNNRNNEVLNKAYNYWKEQIDVDFGKKLKKKRKLKTIYANLATTSILLGDIVKAKEYVKLVKDNAGFFDVFTVDYDRYFKKLELIHKFGSVSKLPKVNKEGSFTYKITLKESGVFNTGRKDRNFTKILIDRFIPKNNSNIVSLDKGKRPKAQLFENGESKYFYSCTDKNIIKFKDGKTIIFKNIKGTFIPYLKQGEEEVRLY